MCIRDSSKSALGSYEGDKFKDISHYALIQLAKFYEVSVDYLLCRSHTKNHPNADLSDLHLSDDMIEFLKSGLVDNALLCELATHPDFPRLMADLEIYVNGIAAVSYTHLDVYKRQPLSLRISLAEREGFEPSVGLWPTHDFQSCALDQLSHL